MASEQPAQGSREMLKQLQKEEIARAKRSQERAANKPKYRPPTGFQYKDPREGWSFMDRFLGGTGGGRKTEKQLRNEAKRRAEGQETARRREENANRPRPQGGSLWDKGRGGSPHAYGGLADGGSNLAKLRAFTSPAQQEALANATRSGSPTGLKALSQQAGAAGAAGPPGQAGAAGPPGQAGAAGPLGSRAPVGRLRARWPEHDFNPEAMAEAHRLGEEAKGGLFKQMFSLPGAADQRATEAVEEYLSGQNPDSQLPEGVDPWSTMPGGSGPLPGVSPHFGTFAPPSPRPPNLPSVPTNDFGGEATLGGTPDFPQYTPSGPGSIPHQEGMNRIQGVFPSVETGPRGPHSRMDVSDPEVLGAGPTVWEGDPATGRTIEPDPYGNFFPGPPAPTPRRPWRDPPSQVGGTIEHGTIRRDLRTGQETEIPGPTEPLMVSPSTREEFMQGSPPPGMPPATPPVGAPGPMGDPGFGGSPGDLMTGQGVSLGSNPALNTLAVNGGAMPQRQPKLRAGSRFGMI